MHELKYKPGGKVLREFLRDEAEYFQLIRGPVGSGKSAACCIKIFLRAMAQKPGPDGIRRSRWAIVRNSYPELRTTTMNTWKQWFPEHVWGKIVMSPPPYFHHLKKGDLDLEVYFIALDTPGDIRKLLSLELTGIWFNEARELPKAVIDAGTSRTSRYPGQNLGGCSWFGAIADTNAPDEDHWWPVMAGDVPPPDHLSREELLSLVCPPSWKFYNQPGAMRRRVDKQGALLGYELNPEGENLLNLNPDYYYRSIEGKSRDWIRVYVLNELASVTDGRPVFPDYSDDLHLAKDGIEIPAGLPVWLGIDFGLTPSAVFAFKLRHRWLVVGELVARNMGAARFGELLVSELHTRFPNREVHGFGDPAGDFRAQTDEKTPFDMLRVAGLRVRPAPSNDIALRLSAVEATLTRLVDHQPGLLIDAKRCPTLVKGFRGGYHYRRLQVTGSERFDSTPNKNEFSHVMDAAQYLLLGGGEGRDLIRSGTIAPPVVARKSARKRRGMSL